MYMSMFSIKMAEVLCREQIQWSILACCISIMSASIRVSRLLYRHSYHIQYLRLWVRTKDLGSALHWSVVIEVLLYLLHQGRSHIVRSVSWLSCWEKKQTTELPGRFAMNHLNEKLKKDKLLILLFSFSTSIIFRVHSSKVGMSSGSLVLTLVSGPLVTRDLVSCQS